MVVLLLILLLSSLLLLLLLVLSSLAAVAYPFLFSGTWSMPVALIGWAGTS